MKNILIFLLFVLTSIKSFTQVYFEKNYQGIGYDYGVTIQETNDGGYILAGRSIWNADGPVGRLIVKTDSMGDTIWTKKSYTNGIVISVFQADSGGYYIFGNTDDGTWGPPNEAYILYLASNGDSLWSKNFDSVGYAREMIKTMDGGYLIASTKKLIKINPQADTIWTKPSWNGIRAVEQTQDSGFALLASKWYGPPIGWDMLLIKTDSYGDSLWSKQYGGENYQTGISLKQTTDGGYILLGNHNNSIPSMYNWYLVKTDSNGDTIWTKIYTNVYNNEETSKSVIQTNDNGYMLFGTNNNYDMYLIKTDSIGDTLWTKTFGGAGTEYGYTFLKDSKENILMLGTSNSYGIDYDFYLVKTDSNGYLYYPQPLANFIIDSIILNKAYFTNTSDSTWSYKWYFGDGDSSFLENPSHTYLDTGTYNVTLIAYAGNKSDTIEKQLQISEIVGIQNLSNANNFDVQIYPNPNKNILTIKIKSINANSIIIKIFNIQGKEIFTDIVNKYSGDYIKELDTSKFSKGIYTVQAIIGDEIIAKRFIIE